MFKLFTTSFPISTDIFSKMFKSSFARYTSKLANKKVRKLGNEKLTKKLTNKELTKY